jgi:oligopeptide/dipeptide ABC transporter ATP-binding protein
MDQPLLQVKELSLSFPRQTGRQRILDRVSLEVRAHEVVGLVGESGSGKTLTSLAIIRLLPRSAQIDGGTVWFDGQDLLSLSEGRVRGMRGAQIAMIFQSPRASLNPLMRAGDQVARALKQHRGLGRKEAYRQAIELLQHVGISDAEARARAYPHQLSGGMAQRVLVAMMLACRPRLLIADEPTTGLDVTIQAQIFELIKEVQAETGATLLLITHDLGVVSEMCQRVAIMYAGQIMEVASVQALFSEPRHPYTEMLLGSVMRVDRPVDLEGTQPLTPSQTTYQTAGCRFATRCPYVTPACWITPPSATQVGPDHSVNCYRYSEPAA